MGRSGSSVITLWLTAWSAIDNPLPRVASHIVSLVFRVVLPVPIRGLPARVIFVQIKELGLVRKPPGLNDAQHIG
jgi:hypothetical protein